LAQLIIVASMTGQFEAIERTGENLPPNFDVIRRLNQAIAR
jgi:hypothetical protein